MRRLVSLLAALAARLALAEDLFVDAHKVMAVEARAGGVGVRVLDEDRVAAFHFDHELLLVLIKPGRLYAVDIKPRRDGTLPEPQAALIGDLSEALGDLSWWTPLLGTLSETQAAAANRNHSPDDHLRAGDIVVAKEDFDGKRLITILPRPQVEAEIECLRALSFR